MFKINKKMEYALIALKHMSQKAPGQLTSAKEISETHHTPFAPTSRVLQIMTQHGILRAEQGIHGGYQILKDLSRVSLEDLNEMIVGPIQITSCLTVSDNRCRGQESCSMIKPMSRLNGLIKNVFAQIKLDAFLHVRASERHAEGCKEVPA